MLIYYLHSVLFRPTELLIVHLSVLPPAAVDMATQTETEEQEDEVRVVEANEIQPVYGNTDYVTLKVVSQDFTETHFRVKQETCLVKVKKAYADRNQRSASSLRFLFDGRRLNGIETPASLEMEISSKCLTRSSWVWMKRRM